MIASRSLLMVGLITIITLHKQTAMAADRADVYREVLEGSKLTPAAAQQLEAALQQNTDSAG